MWTVTKAVHDNMNKSAWHKQYNEVDRLTKYLSYLMNDEFSPPIWVSNQLPELFCL